MTEETKLNCSVNYNYREGYQQGRADAILQKVDFIENSNFNPKMFQICLDNAHDCGYKKGRADKYQEIVSEYMLLTEKQVADIRTDAIEEIIKAIDEQNYCMQEECPFNACRFEGCPINRNAEVIFQTWLKKLKEQTDE